MIFSDSILAQDKISLLPEELFDIARTFGCDQVEDFFNRPGMVKPPYVYGVFPGAEENSAAFWCEKRVESKKKYFLLFMFKNKTHEQSKCSNYIEWNNYPGGLSINSDKRIRLNDFSYIKKPQKKGPNVTVKYNVISSYYDGLEELFYCYKGEWLVRMRH
jgi:hypothetical protein